MRWATTELISGGWRVETDLPATARTTRRPKRAFGLAPHWPPAGARAQQPLPSLGVPKRTNVFQEVVAIIHEHMAGEANVEESALLPHRVTGTAREVDVVIRSKVAGHEVIVSVEATFTGRKADVNWVERLVKKHSDLPTSKLVLVSEAGFTPDARKQAEHDGAVPLIPEDLAGEDPALAIVSKLPSLWPKTVVLKPTSATALVRKSDGTATLVRDLQPDHLLFFEDGQPAVLLRDAFHRVYETNFLQLVGTMGG